MLEKIFKLKSNKTNVKTEIMAGITTFMTMAYIIALNPNLLTNFGAEGQSPSDAVSFQDEGSRGNKKNI